MVVKKKETKKKENKQINKKRSNIYRISCRERVEYFSFLRNFCRSQLHTILRTTHFGQVIFRLHYYIVEYSHSIYNMFIFFFFLFTLLLYHLHCLYINRNCHVSVLSHRFNKINELHRRLSNYRCWLYLNGIEKE